MSERLVRWRCLRCREGHRHEKARRRGTTLQVLEPLVQKLTEIEQRALRGEAIAVVDLVRALGNMLAAPRGGRRWRCS